MPSKQKFFATGFSCVLAIIFTVSITVGLACVFHTNGTSDTLTASENKVLNALNSDPYDTNQWRTLSRLAFDKDQVALGMNARNLSDKLSNSTAQYSLNQYQETAIAQ